MPSEVATRAAEDTVLTYIFENTRPIELIDLTSSLTAIGDQYLSFVRRSNETSEENDFRLYVREVRTGSIIIDLVTMAAQQPIFGLAAPLVAQYAGELGEWFDFFKGVKDAKDIKEMLVGKSKKDLQQISEIIEPAAKDSGSNITINAAQGAVILVNSSINSTQANAGQNVLRRHIDHIAAPVTGIHHDQVLYWNQMRDDKAAKPGDKAVIERIWKNPVKVTFSSENIKRTMIDNPENPFRKFFLVDVDVTENQGKPVLYKILQVKETWDRE